MDTLQEKNNYNIYWEVYNMDCENDTCEKEKRGCEGCFYYKLNKAIDDKLKETKDKDEV